jgi:hypothetical protein
MGMLRGARHELDDVVGSSTRRPTPSDEVVFGGELRALAARPAPPGGAAHRRRRHARRRRDSPRWCPDLAERETWACGPAGMLDALEEHFAALGIAERLHTERFRASVVVTGDGRHGELRRADVTVEADGATPLLDAGEAAGVLMPSGCRMGICFGCVVPAALRRRPRPARRHRHHRRRGRRRRIQTCINAAAGACDIDL